MKKLNSKEDFDWYVKELDVEGHYHYKHNGKPEKYPCIVGSSYWDDPNGPYNYDHHFYYEEVHECSECGYKTKKFPISKEQENEIH